MRFRVAGKKIQGDIKQMLTFFVRVRDLDFLSVIALIKRQIGNSPSFTYRRLDLTIELALAIFPSQPAPFIHTQAWLHVGKCTKFMTVVVTGWFV